jgi:hypothetical protein
MKFRFCENCLRDVRYIVRKSKNNFRGINYNGKAAYCSKCGKEIYVGYVNDYNLKRLWSRKRMKKVIKSAGVKIIKEDKQ